MYFISQNTVVSFLFFLIAKNVSCRSTILLSGRLEKMIILFLVFVTSSRHKIMVKSLKNHDSQKNGIDDLIVKNLFKNTIEFKRGLYRSNFVKKNISCLMQFFAENKNIFDQGTVICFNEFCWPAVVCEYYSKGQFLVVENANHRTGLGIFAPRGFTKSGFEVALTELQTLGISITPFEKILKVVCKLSMTGVILRHCHFSSIVERIFMRGVWYLRIKMLSLERVSVPECPRVIFILQIPDDTAVLSFFGSPMHYLDELAEQMRGYAARGYQIVVRPHPLFRCSKSWKFLKAMKMEGFKIEMAPISESYLQCFSFFVLCSSTMYFAIQNAGLEHRIQVLGGIPTRPLGFDEEKQTGWFFEGWH